MDVLAELGLHSSNPGGCAGPGKWMTTSDCGVLPSINPATGETIASVNLCSPDDYETMVQAALRAFEEWRTVPAPRRGEVIRLIAQALREKKDALGSLVSMEVGKIKGGR